MAFDNVIAVNPDHADAYYHLGFSYAKSGMTDKASEVLERAIKLDPNDENSKRLLKELTWVGKSKDF